ncbi:MAG: hypothetical protein AB9869_09610 [Verrucomicrobiia bacterium]
MVCREKVGEAVDLPGCCSRRFVAPHRVIPRQDATAVAFVSGKWNFVAEELVFPIQVCHLPPGTSKQNNFEHRLFSSITQNWRGEPLISHDVIVNLIKRRRPAKNASRSGCG